MQRPQSRTNEKGLPQLGQCWRAHTQIQGQYPYDAEVHSALGCVAWPIKVRKVSEGIAFVETDVIEILA